MPPRAFFAAGLVFVLPALGAGEAGDFAYLRDARPALAAGAVPIDTRAAEACLARSVAGARCLPAGEFLGPHRSLVSWRDVLWLLGTAGLRGDETVLVIGDAPAERDFVAGLLYLAGCKRVLVLAQPLSAALAQETLPQPGSARGFSRSAVFEAPMRDSLVVLGHELRGMRPAPFLLDGRSEEEYWGEKVRAARGGHLPGAHSLPAVRLRAAPAGETEVLPAATPVAYGHDALEGLAYFTVLRAGHGVDARIYPGGWAEWAAHSAWPADAVTYPERQAPASSAGNGNHSRAWWAWLAGAIGLAAAFFAGAALFAHRRTG